MNQTIVWTVGDIIGLVIFALIVFCFALAAVITRVKQFRCKHEKYYETQSCDAICSRCGKNLGFIGRLKKKGAP